MSSALYSGWIAHRRFTPTTHSFRYQIGLVYLDLDEQDAVLGMSPLAGKSRFAPFSFRESDYMKTYTKTGTRLIDAVRQQVGQALGYAPQGAIRLLTQPRSWGLSFNPVSFFYCYEPDGQLAAILCEVSNTPWGECYHYVLPAQGDSHQQFAVAKAFHVSPFLPYDLEYRMSFSPPEDQLGVHIAAWQGELKMFDATLNLRRIELDRTGLHRYLSQFPWMTAKTCLAIYWQALRLFLKRTQIFPHRTADGTFRIATLQPKDKRHEKP